MNKICAGVCDSDPSNDSHYNCEGVCGGDMTECEECDGVYDCTGTCSGTAIVDDCGVCGGNNAAIDCAGVCFGDDGTSCENSVLLSLMATDGGLDVYMSNSAPVVGFQFSVSGISLSGASGGSADDSGFSVSTGPNGVIGFSMSGSTIAAGDGLLTSLTGDFNAAESCIGDLILSVDAEGFLTQSTGDCVATGWTEPELSVDILYSSDADKLNIFFFRFK